MNSTHDRAPFFFGQPFAHTHTPFFLPYIFALLPPVPPQVSFLRSKKRGGETRVQDRTFLDFAPFSFPF